MEVVEEKDLGQLAIDCLSHQCDVNNKEREM